MIARDKIGFVTGLTAEAKLLRGMGFGVAAGGGTPEGAYKAALRLADAGALVLVSFGLAGGLRRGLAPGAVLVPDAVMEGGKRYACDLTLMAFLGGTTGEAMLAGKSIAATAHDKTALFRRSRLPAIDLESGAVARAAAERGLPFAVLRAVADPAERDLAPAALIALKANGGIDLMGVLRSVLGRPKQIPGLIALARDAGRARAALVKRLKDIC